MTRFADLTAATDSGGVIFSFPTSLLKVAWEPTEYRISQLYE